MDSNKQGDHFNRELLNVDVDEGDNARGKKLKNRYIQEYTTETTFEPKI